MQPLWKTVWRFLKKLKSELPHNPALPLLGINQKKTSTLIQKIHAPLCSLQDYLQKPTSGNSPGVTCSIMDGPREQCAKWKSKTNTILFLLYESFQKGVNILLMPLSIFFLWLLLRCSFFLNHHLRKCLLIL